MSREGPPAAPPESFSRTLADLPARFRRQCAEQARRVRPVDPAPFRALAAELAPALAGTELAPDAPTAEVARERLARGLALAHAQAGNAGVEAVRVAATTWQRLSGEPILLHGTGSWALGGIARDRALRPGGDGLTGEVAMSGTPQDALFVCEGFTPTGLYSAAAFACSNAGTTGEELALSAVRAGHVGWVEWLAVLIFSLAPPTFTADTRAFAAQLRRYRTLERDRALLDAIQRVAERARLGLITGDGREYTRQLPREDDVEGLIQNVLFLVTEWMAHDADLMSLPARIRLAAGVERYLGRARGTLTCPLPEDSAEVAAAKLARLDVLSRQFPCVLVLDAAGIALSADALHPLSRERLVFAPIPVAATRVVFVPDRHRGEAAGWLSQAGAHPEVLPFEALEAWRLVAEAARAGDPE